MNKYFKETIWFFGLIILTLLFFIKLFSINELQSGAAILNIKDSYYVASSYLYAIIIFLALAFIIYPARFLHYKFKNNKTANILFILLNTVTVGVFSWLMIFNYENKSIDFVTMKGEMQFEDSYPIANPYIMIIFQLLLISSLLYTIYKTTKKFKTIANEK